MPGMVIGSSLSYVGQGEIGAVDSNSPIITPGKVSLSATGALISAVVGTLITPLVGALLLTGLLSSPVQSTVITPDVGSAVISGVVSAPVQGTIITPAVGSVALSGIIPTEGIAIIPSVGSAVISGVTPIQASIITPNSGATSIISDNFNRTDETPIADPPWQAAGGLPKPNLASNVVSHAGATGDEAAFYNQNTFKDNQYSQWKIISGTLDVAILVRASTASFYMYDVYDDVSGNHHLFYWDGAVFNLITSVAGDTLAVNDVIRLEVRGDVLTGKINGVTKVTANHSTLTSGRPGLYSYYAGETRDDWDGGNLGESLSLSGIAPLLNIGQIITPAAGAIVLVGQTPVIQEVGGVNITPAAGALVISGLTPTQYLTITPDVGSLTASGVASIVSIDFILTPLDKAVRFDNTADYLQRTTSLPSSTAFTICGWVKRKVDTGTWTYFAAIEASGSSAWEVMGLGNDGIQELFQISWNNQGTNSTVVPITDKWFFFAFTCQGTGVSDLKGYAKRLLTDSLVLANGQGRSFTPVALTLGNDLVSEVFNGEMYGVKIWTAALSSAELEEEAKSTRPVRTANLYAVIPMRSAATAGNDESGLGNNFTVGGTLSDGSDNPLTGIFLLGKTPTVIQNIFIVPSAGSLVLSGTTPTEAINVIPTVSSLVLVGQTPTVQEQANISITPNVGTFTLNGIAPTGVISILVRTDRASFVSGPTHGTGSFITGSFTPKNDSLLVVCVSVSEQDGITNPVNDITISDSVGLTWTSRLAIGNANLWSAGVRVFTAPVGTGQSMTLTLDCGTRNISTYIVHVIEYIGYKQTDPTGATVTNGSSGTDGPLTLTLSASPALDSEVLGFKFNDLSTTGTGITGEGLGWTEIYDLGQLDFCYLGSQARIYSVSTDVRWEDISIGTATIAKSISAGIEIKAATGPYITPSSGSLVLVGQLVEVQEGGGVTIIPTVGELVITGFTPTQYINITPDVGALILSGVLANPAQGIIQTPTGGSLVLSGVVASPVQGVPQTPTVGALVLSGSVPSIVQDFIRQPVAGALVLSGVAVIPSQDFIRQPVAGALVLSGVAVIPSQSIVLIPNTGSLVVTGVTPNINTGIIPATVTLNLSGTVANLLLDTLRTPNAGTLILSGVAPIITEGVIPSAGAVLISGQSPSLKIDIYLTPIVGEVVLTGSTPTVTGESPRITPDSGALILTGIVPNFDKSITIPVGTLTIEGLSPSIAQSLIFTPATGALVLSGTNGVLSQSTVITPIVNSLLLSGVASQPIQGTVRTPTQGVISLVGIAPLIIQDIIKIPTVGVVVLSGNTSIVIQNIIVLPSTGLLSLTSLTPSVVGGILTTPVAGSLLLSGIQVTPVQSIIRIPTVGEITISGITLVLNQGIIISNGSLNLTGLISSIIQGSNLTPEVGALILSGGTYSTPISFAIYNKQFFTRLYQNLYVIDKKDFQIKYKKDFEII